MQVQLERGDSGGIPVQRRRKELGARAATEGDNVEGSGGRCGGREVGWHYGIEDMERHACVYRGCAQGVACNDAGAVLDDSSGANGSP